MACCLSEGNLKCTQKLSKAACSFDLKLAEMQIERVYDCSFLEWCERTGPVPSSCSKDKQGRIFE